MEYTCNTKHCNKEKYFSLKDSNYIPTDISTMVQTLGYFQYKAPDISSIHSWTLPQNKHEEVYNLFFETANFEAKVFASSQKILQKRFNENHLSKEKFCYKCKRFVCIKESKESKLDCLLRHMRNSIAHGLIYLPANNSPFICFKDLDKNKNESAIIICKREDLNNWKNIIEQYKK